MYIIEKRIVYYRKNVIPGNEDIVRRRLKYDNSDSITGHIWNFLDNEYIEDYDEEVDNMSFIPGNLETIKDSPQFELFEDIRKVNRDGRFYTESTLIWDSNQKKSNFNLIKVI